MTKLTGQCLCGAISFEADGEVPVMANCHCTDCRKATGSAYAALMFMKESDVKITGTTKTFQHNSDAGSLMTKHFCENCGSPMFTQNSNRPGMIGLRAGTINEQQEFTPKANVYTSSVMAATILDENLPAFAKMPG
ncbi:GFA family protein [Pelagimonas sp. KU-00592-HH]|uniref:GFA family protein n=1 Tax=Roseobacteraceae TaxID=2854170 RepID=UPI0020CE8B7E|nr:GFA family protein [Shimia sp. CNT1-13L.2]MCP9484008.1 GFA family protein [Shimia sp. CNT1-13L.2]